ncbi:hypothetical protein TRIUR3_34554 [Triticum urartu]|uniref:Uncharacterized protein n=1 Tax=Triticum urartu TaxID=4572 RepID=M7ZHA1_TRIUA|nr:hypothetical protein TRIUR3_34554 [Triticum urartu]
MERTGMMKMATGKGLPPPAGCQNRLSPSPERLASVTARLGSGGGGGFGGCWGGVRVWRPIHWGLGFRGGDWVRGVREEGIGCGAWEG